MSVYLHMHKIVISKRANGYLHKYLTDFTEHDKAIIQGAQSGDEFVWLLHKNGTELCKIRNGSSSGWVTHWLTKIPDPYVPTLCYLVTITSKGGETGTVVPISYERATELAKLPRPDNKGVSLILQ